MRALAAMLVVVLGCNDRDDYHQTHDPQPDAPKPDAPGACVPVCGAQTCGVDPVCGESCGTCQLGSHCAVGTCVPDGTTCVPRTCSGACGVIDDGCGGQLDCGACATPRWVDIGAGTEFACALRSDHTVWCWGYNRYGQLGPNATPFANATSPVQVGGLTDAVSLSVGAAHVCAIRSNDDRAWCWGLGSRGELGNGGTASSASPVAMGAATGDTSSVALVAAGNEHTCLVRSSGKLECAGANDAGQLGDGTTDDHATPRLAGGLMIAAAAGDGHTCAISSSHDLYCGGAGGAGQLANGSLASSTGIYQRDSAHDWQSLDLGDSFSCGTRSGGRLECWGYNLWGQVGIGSFDNAIEQPTAVGSSLTWARVSAGSRHACAIDVTGKLFCWGDGSSGQLGYGSTIGTTTPQYVGPDFARVSAGGSHSCAVKVDGTAWCWGDNTWGQLGDGDTSSALSPQQVH